MMLPSGGPSGITSYVRDLAYGLSSRGFLTSFAIYSRKDFGISFISDLELGFDILHLQNLLLGPLFTSNVTSLFYGYEMVCTVHNPPREIERASGRRLIRLATRRLKALIFVSHWLRRRISPSVHPGVPQHVIYPGIDINIFKPIAPSLELKEKLNLKDKKVILFVGRLVRSKGIYDLIESIKTVKNSCKDVVLVFCGIGKEFYRIQRKVK